MEVEWVEELPSRAPRGRQPEPKYKAFLEALRKRPGVWAVLIKVHESDQKASKLASDLRTGRVKSPPGRYEYASRGTTVYARYLGEED